MLITEERIKEIEAKISREFGFYNNVGKRNLELWEFIKKELNAKEVKVLKNFEDYCLKDDNVFAVAKEKGMIIVGNINTCDNCEYFQGIEKQEIKCSFIKPFDFSRKYLESKGWALEDEEKNYYIHKNFNLDKNLYRISLKIDFNTEDADVEIKTFDLIQGENYLFQGSIKTPQQFETIIECMDYVLDRELEKEEKSV